MKFGHVLPSRSHASHGNCVLPSNLCSLFNEQELNRQIMKNTAMRSGGLDKDHLT